MTKYIIKLDVGFGEHQEIIEAENLEEATEEAQQMYFDQMEGYYHAELYTKELAKEYGISEKEPTEN